MFVYRVVKTRARAKDLSGTGAYQYGGRWNNKGTYMLYASATSSLALLENLVHFDESEFPPKLFILRLEINDNATIYTPRVDEYSPEWKHYELLENKKMGDQWMSEMEFLAIKVRSAVNDLEYNYLLNPIFPGFHELVKLVDVHEIKLDDRLVKRNI